MTLFRTRRRYTPELLRDNLTHFFVFGDNTERYGMGGQALIRYEPNAIGLVTKWTPTVLERSFFGDRDYSQLFGDDIVNILMLAQTHNVVIPFSHRVELGTGLSQLPERAPLLYAVLSQIFTADLPEAELS